MIGEAKHSETGDTLVIYMSVETGILWARPSSMFYELIDLSDGRKSVPRFEKVDEA